MKRLVVGLFAVALSSGALTARQAPAVMPDFSGVYYPAPVNSGNAGRGTPPPAAAPAPIAPPTRSAPVEDGSRGRTATAPKLTPTYMQRWEMMRKSRISGSSEFDPRVRCVPSGMPSMMNMYYGMEVAQTRDKIVIYGELNDLYRRIYLDGRQPSAKVLNDPTYAGYSTGRWQGDTLIVDTVALREDSLIEDFASFSPHSAKMTVREEIRFVEPGLLEDRITVSDPEALVEPYVMVRRFRKASPPNDELREAACAEGLELAK